MKKGIWIFLAILLFLNCNSSKKSALISDFETSLGEKNSKDLTKFIDDFEREVLSTNYQSGNLSKGYRMFAESCNQMDAGEALSIIRPTFNEFRQSQIWNEIFAQVDSIWIGKYEQLDARVIYNSENGPLQIGKTGYPFRKISNIDSLKQAILKWQVWNYRGKYFKALGKVKNTNSFIREYYEVKATVGEISSTLFCGMIIKHKPNFNNYFVKRIIAVELARLYVS